MYIHVKRIIDFILAFIALVLLSPLFLVLALWIKMDSKGPVFFKQKRIGINRSFFQIHKFRTMLSETPSDMPTHLFDNPDAFITRSGRFLRKTSLDELPQLINILKEEMAFIGHALRCGTKMI